MLKKLFLGVILLLVVSCSKDLEMLDNQVIEISQGFTHSGISQAICINPTSKVVYTGRNGQEIYSISNGEPVLLTVIEEAAGYWGAPTFVTDLELFEGKLYAAAKNMIIEIDVLSGEYKPIIVYPFSGPWGAYDLVVDKRGSIIVADHFGGIHFFDKMSGWQHTELLTNIDTIGPTGNFTGVTLSEDEKELYVLDADNSLLITVKLKWSSNIPEAKKIDLMELDLVYPEYLKIWQGDLFIQAARENKMLRLRDGVVIQNLSYTTIDGSSPNGIVTFVIDPINEESATYIGTSFNFEQGVYSGNLTF